MQHVQATGNQGIPVPFELTLSSSVYTGMESTWNWDASMTGSSAIGMVKEVRDRFWATSSHLYICLVNQS